MPFLPQVFRRPRKPSRQSRPASLRVPPLILRLVTWQRTSFSEPLVFSGISGLSSTISNSLLLARWRASRRSSEAKRVLWPKIRSNRADKTALRRRGMAAPGFETAIELPDQAADAALRVALGFGERIELVNQAFAMNPAQTMKTDIELASVVADDHGVGEKAMRLDAAPCGGFAGDQHGIGMD